MAAFNLRSTFQAGSSIEGVAFGLAGFFVFPIHDAIAKLLIRDISVWQIMFVRSCGILLLVTAFNGVAPFPRAFKSPVRLLLGARALMLVAAWALYYSAARYLALSEMVTIYFGSPILVACMAGPILGERVTPGPMARSRHGLRGRPHRLPPRHRRLRADISGSRRGGTMVGVHHPDPVDQARGAD